MCPRRWSAGVAAAPPLPRPRGGRGGEGTRVRGILEERRNCLAAAPGSEGAAGFSVGAAPTPPRFPAPPGGERH